MLLQSTLQLPPFMLNNVLSQVEDRGVVLEGALGIAACGHPLLQYYSIPAPSWSSSDSSHKRPPALFLYQRACGPSAVHMLHAGEMGGTIINHPGSYLKAIADIKAGWKSPAELCTGVAFFGAFTPGEMNRGPGMS